MASIAAMGVPTKAFAPLRLVAGLTDEQMTSLLETLATPTAGIASPRGLADKVSQLGEPYTRPLARDLISTLFNLSSLHAIHDWALEDIAEVVARNPAIEFSDAERAVIGSRLRSLLAEPTVTTLAKATSIAYEYPNTFHSARIVSDLRPIFTDDPSAEPSGVMIAHTLRIDYHGPSGRDEFYVSMTRDALIELAAALARAQEKDETLRRVVTKAGLDEFDATFD